jgi:hypothetical protein
MLTTTIERRATLALLSIDPPGQAPEGLIWALAGSIWTPGGVLEEESTYEMSVKGDDRRPSTIFERLATHVRATVTLTDDKRKVHHIRISTTQDPDRH